MHNWIALGVVIFIAISGAWIINNEPEVEYGTSYMCEDGVTYIVMRGYNKLGISVLFNADGSVKTCSSNG